MAYGPVTPRGRRAPSGRPRGRPPSSLTGSRSRDQVNEDPSGPASSDIKEPPRKRIRYVPGGPGGGGRYMEVDSDDGATGTPKVPRRPRASANTPNFSPRQRSTRIRNPISRSQTEEMRYSSAAAVAAAVVQSDGYKPREERGWEEFHPNLDIDATFMVFHAEDVDGTAKLASETPASNSQDASANGSSTPSRHINPSSTGNTPVRQTSVAPTPIALNIGTPIPRRRGRPPRDPLAYYARLAEANGGSLYTPRVLPIHNQTPKERLDLKLPSFRKTDRILLFESKTFGQARYVDKGMMNAGYQESDNFIRPDLKLIKAADSNPDEDLEQATGAKTDSDSVQHGIGNNVRVEYDMDEQDDMWLETVNARRKEQALLPITREHFEITITRIEKEWHALEKRIPKPNPKPPQTHRPRSSSAAAVNGEPQVGEEQDSKCAICDDGDCENTNAIVFCDGCDLAVHQECYGVPFIPEGQWLCRKCQLIGRGIPTCIFCPNTDGAFKQTNSSKWAHLLCAMWIPEVSLGNHTFMEPVMDVEKVPKTRWKLNCYICHQRMGACIQCGNKSCYQAFHVTCARRARLYLKMKNSHGALAVLDGNTVLKAFCDKHCPPDYTKENAVHQATRAAKKFYKRTMKGRIWADNHATAHALAASHRLALTEHPPDESQMVGASIMVASAGQGDKKGQPGKPVWKLPSGAPVIPQAVYETVDAGLNRFSIQKRKEFVAEACRYWTLKREARRGAALLKRLQLQMETFSSMELTRRNFAAMGPSGKARLRRRIEFAETLLKDLEQLRALSQEVVQREQIKLEDAELAQEFVDTCYFPVAKHFVPVVDKALSLDKDVFKKGLAGLQAKLEQRFYTTTLPFWQEMCNIIQEGIITEPEPEKLTQPRFEPVDGLVVKKTFTDIRQRRSLGKRILKMVQPQVEKALRMECDISSKAYDELHGEFLSIMDATFDAKQRSPALNGDVGAEKQNEDTVMDDAPALVATPMKGKARLDGSAVGSLMNGANDDAMDTRPDGADGADDDGKDGNGSPPTNGVLSSNASTAGLDMELTGGSKGPGNDAQGVDARETAAASNTPPATNGYVSALPRINPPAPPTPPQSTGSFGNGPAVTGSGRSGSAGAAAMTPDVLTEGGGVPWFLQAFDPRGLSVVEERWAGKDIVRGLSEDLTDIDDDELKGLGIAVNDGAVVAAVAAAAAAKRQREEVEKEQIHVDVEEVAAADDVAAGKLGVDEALTTPKGRATRGRKRQSTGRKRR